MIVRRRSPPVNAGPGPVRWTTDWSDPIVWVLTVFIVLDFTYAVSFNLLSDQVRLIFIGVLFLGQGSVGIGSLLLRIDIWRLRWFSLIVGMVGVWLISHAVFGNPFEAEAAIRRLAPVAAALMFVGFADRLPARLIVYGAGFTIVFAAMWAAAQPAYFHGFGSDLSRFAPFHGGEEKNAHASSYVVLACVIIVHQGMLGRFIHRTLGWGFIAAGAVLIGGYWSTQVQLAFVAYFGAYVLFYNRIALTARVVAVLVFMALVGVILVDKETRGIESSGSPTFQASGAGTGRVGTWIGRIDLLQQRSAAQLIIGEGIQTDNYTSPTWPKLTHSHNLILTYMLESGIIGTVLFHTIFLFPLGRFGRFYVPIAAAMLAASLVGPGIMHRAMAYQLLWLGVGIMALRHQLAPYARTVGKKMVRSPAARRVVDSRVLQRT